MKSASHCLLESRRVLTGFVGVLLLLAVLASLLLTQAWPWLGMLLSTVLIAAAAVAVAVRSVNLAQRRTQAALRRELASHVDAIYGCLEARHALERELGPNIVLPPMRGPVISPDAAWRLYQHTITHRPETVVEFGSGVSTLLIAHALERNGNGTLISLDHEPRFAKATETLLQPHNLEHRVKIHCAPLRSHRTLDGLCELYYDTTPLEAIEAVDLVLVDGPPRTLDPYIRDLALPVMAPRMSTGGTLFLDDASRPGEQAILQRWRSAWPDFEFDYLPLDTGLAVVRKPATERRDEP